MNSGPLALSCTTLGVFAHKVNEKLHFGATYLDDKSVENILSKKSKGFLHKQRLEGQRKRLEGNTQRGSFMWVLSLVRG